MKTFKEFLNERKGFCNEKKGRLVTTSYVLQQKLQKTTGEKMRKYSKKELIDLKNKSTSFLKRTETRRKKVYTRQELINMKKVPFSYNKRIKKDRRK